jgi:2-succinyl-5-enolpyruvyl-6-hydroxy-3-cyclohexene-1-carboxylate synthase
MRTTDHPGAHVLISTLKSLGLTDVVISTGSRNAPLVLAAHAAGLNITVALDERSAAHVALGMALKSGRPCCVVTTSGTAALNHGPAIAEAFYMGVPLISLTADRPLAARNTGPGQMVVQNQAFESHTIYSVELDELAMSESELHGAAIDIWRKASRGPVHVNIPFAEPLYGMTEAESRTIPLSQPDEDSRHDETIPEDLVDLLSIHDPKVLIVIGAVPEHLRAEGNFEALRDRAAVFADAFGAVQQIHTEPAAACMQLAWSEEDSMAMRPDVIITMGLPPMDKKWRAQLVKWNAPHWHMGADLHGWDMFHSKVGNWNIPLTQGIEELMAALPEFNAYASDWNVRSDRLAAAASDFASSSKEQWTDWHIFERLAFSLEDNASLHFANSTAARYAQWFDWKKRPLHANRGVAGIDGCLSTAVGDALANPDRMVILLTGDTAWQYDANGLAVRPMPANLKVIVINNGGGNIFRWIDGPEDQNTLQRYFEAPFAKNMRGSADHLGLHYCFAENGQQFEKSFAAWRNNDAPSLLELHTSGEASVRYYKALRAATAEALKS